jgi:hypothetical protein
MTNKCYTPGCNNYAISGSAYCSARTSIKFLMLMPDGGTVAQAPAQPLDHHDAAKLSTKEADKEQSNYVASEPGDELV